MTASVPDSSSNKSLHVENEVIPIKLETRFPTHQNAVDLFGNRWFTRIEEVYPGLKSGPHNYLIGDGRPRGAADHLGVIPGSFRGMNILELGPMEGMHTYQIDKLEAESVTAVESNAQAYMRCLVLKEILQHKGRFLLGDVLSYLQDSDTRYDLIFCSGILYHQTNPYALIKAMSERSDKIFLSTHYFDPLFPKGPNVQPRQVDCDGMEITFYEHEYSVDLSTQPFWGGNRPTAAWLTKDTIERLFQHFGFIFSIHSDERTWEVGHNITATAKRII